MWKEITKEWLEDQYVNQRKSTKKIAKEFNIASWTIQNRLKVFGIPTRHGREAHGIHCLIGMKHGRLLIVEELPLGRKGHIRYKCICDCGRETVANRSSILRNHTRSCGCLHREKCRTLRKGYKEVPSKFLGKVMVRAKWRGIEFRITLKDIWEIYERQNRRCNLSGVPIGWPRGGGKTTASVDRIDSDGDYNKDNIQLVHYTVNLMKQSLSQKEFVDWCKLITEYNNENTL